MKRAYLNVKFDFELPRALVNTIYFDFSRPQNESHKIRLSFHVHYKILKPENLLG